MSTLIGDDGNLPPLTFGASLTPTDVWKRAMLGIPNVAFKIGKLRVPYSVYSLAYRDEKAEGDAPGDYQRRHGCVLAALAEASNGEASTGFLDRGDEFMTGFWSGYALHGSDRKPKPAATQP